MLNQLPRLPEARAPRAIVRVGSGLADPGTVITGWVSWEVTNNTYYQADTFRVSFAASVLPAANGPDWFSRQTEAYVEIMAGFPADPSSFTAAELSSLIYGRVDDIEFDPVRAEITLTGRDLTAVFIDAKTTAQWQNLTASQIAEKLAAAHGLGVGSITATPRTVGSYYEIDHVRIEQERSEWDLLTWLASEEGFACYVSGKDLHFEADTRETAEPYVIRWEAPDADRGYPVANAQTLAFSRSLTVAKGVNVTVRSWNAKQKKGFNASYPGKAKVTQAGKASPFGNQQNYYFSVPGLTQDQATQLAIKKYKEIIAHEMKMHVRMPADNILTTKNMIRVEGTGTAYDQNYYPVSISRQMSIDEGYTMTVEAKNHSPETVPAP